jgi:hypothetical protein
MPAARRPAPACLTAVAHSARVAGRRHAARQSVALPGTAARASTHGSPQNNGLMLLSSHAAKMPPMVLIQSSALLPHISRCCPCAACPTWLRDGPTAAARAPQADAKGRERPTQSPASERTPAGAARQHFLLAPHATAERRRLPTRHSASKRTPVWGRRASSRPGTTGRRRRPGTRRRAPSAAP